MVKPRKAVDDFKKAHPDLTVTTVLDYDENYYVLEAVKDTSKTDYNAPFFAIGKKDGKIVNFTPGEDFDKFFDAMDNGNITSQVL